MPFINISPDENSCIARLREACFHLGHQHARLWSIGLKEILGRAIPVAHGGLEIEFLVSNQAMPGAPTNHTPEHVAPAPIERTEAKAEQLVPWVTGEPFPSEDTLRNRLRRDGHRITLGVCVPVDLSDWLRDAVAAMPGASISSICASAITTKLKELEAQRGKPFPERPKPGEDPLTKTSTPITSGKAASKRRKQNGGS